MIPDVSHGSAGMIAQGEEAGQRFYRAPGAAKGAENARPPGLIQAVVFGGCGGALWIAGKQWPGVSVRDRGLKPVFAPSRLLETERSTSVVLRASVDIRSQAASQRPDSLPS